MWANLVGSGQTAKKNGQLWVRLVELVSLINKNGLGNCKGKG